MPGHPPCSSRTHSADSEWGPILAFLVLVNAVGWSACLFLRSTFAAGYLWAFFTFVFVTVWSPTVIALALSFSFEGTSGVRSHALDEPAVTVKEFGYRPLSVPLGMGQTHALNSPASVSYRKTIAPRLRTLILWP
jgi:hypothetical protein